MMLSVVIPVYNAHEFLGQVLLSLLATTHYDFELILIDDSSGKETRQYVEGIEIPGVQVTKHFNREHQWVNYNWNLGAYMASGIYVAILNSDILLSQDWDVPLMKVLKDSTIACPMELKTVKIKGKFENYKSELDPVIVKVDPKMIKGAAFMFRKSDVEKLFPIPKSIKHWCGDNYLADQANKLQGVKFAEGSYIRHFYSKSGKTIPFDEYIARVTEDVEAYEKLSGRDMSLIKDKLSEYEPPSQTGETSQHI